MADSEFRLNRAGIIEIAKSAGARAELERAARKMASAANADAKSHAEWLRKKGFDTDPYVAGVATLSRTAIGYATTKTEAGAINENRYKSLGNQNH